MSVIHFWTYFIFVGAADLVMILRTWAMYNRSRVILVVLLTLYCIEIASSLVLCAIDSDSKYLPGLFTTSDLLSIATVVARQMLEFSVCKPDLSTLVRWWARAVIILQMVHGAVLCILTSAQFLRLSLQMYRATGQWQSNQYISLLVREGVLYFFAFFLLNLISLLIGFRFLPLEGWPKILYLPAELVPVYTLTPRFIISMRELYARDVQRGCNETKIDTGFGISGRPGNGPSVTTMSFVDDAVESVNLEDVEDVSPMEVVWSLKTESV